MPSRWIRIEMLMLYQIDDTYLNCCHAHFFRPLFMLSFPFIVHSVSFCDHSFYHFLMYFFLFFTSHGFLFENNVPIFHIIYFSIEISYFVHFFYFSADCMMGFSTFFHIHKPAIDIHHAWI